MTKRMFKINLWAEDMAQWLRALAALLKALSPNPRNHMVIHNYLK
jgi:aminoglycoside phosphotransferase (APT) family kinase protein